MKKRNFYQILENYQKWYKGLPEKEIKKIAISTWQIPKLEEINKRMLEKAQEMSNKGLKPKTFRWIIGNLEEQKRVEKEFKIKLKTNWKDEYEKGGIKGIFQILLAKIIIKFQKEKTA